MDNLIDNAYFIYLEDKEIERISIPKEVQELNDFAYGLEEYLQRRVICTVSFIGISSTYGYGYQIKLTSKIIDFNYILCDIYISQDNNNVETYIYEKEYDSCNKILNLKETLFMVLERHIKSGLIPYLKSA